jgi:hypothetical protein
MREFQFFESIIEKNIFKFISSLQPFTKQVFGETEIQFADARPFLGQKIHEEHSSQSTRLAVRPRRTNQRHCYFSCFREVGDDVVLYELKEYSPLLDSSNMSSNDWIRIAKDVEVSLAPTIYSHLRFVTFRLIITIMMDL